MMHCMRFAQPFRSSVNVFVEQLFKRYFTSKTFKWVIFLKIKNLN